MSLLTTLKGLPLSYSKDLQEDKEPVFDSFDNLLICLEVIKGIIKGIKINKKEMLNACKQGNLMATDLAEWIVLNLNVSFREAYKITTQIVKMAEKNNCQINDLKPKDLKSLNLKLRNKIHDFLKIENSIKYKKSFGSTAPIEVRKAIKKAKKEIY